MSIKRYKYNTVICTVALVIPFNVMADVKYDELKAQVELLQQQLKQVQAALSEQQTKSVTKQDLVQIKQNVADVSAKASEWKSSDSVVLLSGNAVIGYSDTQNNPGAFNAVHFNPIFLYQYKDFLLMETQLASSLSSDGSTNYGMEYGTVNLTLTDSMTLVAGKFMSPLGQFRQNRHPHWVNKLTSTPAGFGEDQAAPSSDVGVELRGGFALGSNTSFANYAVYTANGPELTITSNKISGIPTGGIASNKDGKYVYGGRLGFLPIPMLEIGVSGATGKVAGTNEVNAIRNYDVYGFDFNYKYNNIHLFSEYIKQKIGATSNSVAPGSASWNAFYAEASYRLMPTAWEGVMRYSDYNSYNNEEDQSQWALGVNYYFSSAAIAKFAYNFNNGKTNTIANNNAFQAQLVYGF